MRHAVCWVLCTLALTAGVPPSAVPTTISPTPSPTLPPLPALSLEQKIGQLFIIGFEGPTVTPELRVMIERYHVGGVIVFGINGNLENPSQIATLTRELQSLALASGHPGLFLAIDQEGGRVARLTEFMGFTEMPSAMALAATGDVENARRAAQVLAREMKAVGLNVNFAPDLDVNVNAANPVIGTRSFGSGPQTVSAYGLACVRGLQAEGALAFGKHFPGHGDTAVDSHLALPVVPHDRARLDAVEFVPFRAAMRANIAGIMSAHVAFPTFDADGTPATLSHAVLTDLLRDEFAYAGLLVTDSLEMGALRESLALSPAQAALRAFKAGADLLLFNTGHADHREAFELILKAVRSGEVSAARLEESVRRILHAKADFGLLEPSLADSASAAANVGTPGHRSLADEFAAHSITLLRDDARLLPLAPDAKPFVAEASAATGLAALLDGSPIPLPAHPTAADLITLRGVARAHPERPLIITLAGAQADSAQAQLVNRLLAEGVPLIVVAVRDPYDLLSVPTAPTMLATYASPPPTLRALAVVLQGGATPRGRLPVELPGLFAVGAGLRDFVR